MAIDSLEIQEYMLSKGYTKEDLKELFNNTTLTTVKKETLLTKLKENYELLAEIGFRPNEIVKISKTLPNLYNYSITNLKDKVKNFQELDYTKQDIIKMTKILPALLSYSIENIKQKRTDLIDLGYTEKDINKITKAFPSIYAYSIEYINKKLNDLIELGYTKEEVLKLTKSLPTLYGLSTKYIKQKIEDLMSFGYSKQEALNMTKQLPTLLGLKKENIKQKIDFYKATNLDFIILEDTKKLMQSIDLTYARFMYLKEQGQELNKRNYSKLFYGEQIFEKRYKIKKEELLTKYPYTKQEYIKKKEK